MTTVRTGLGWPIPRTATAEPVGLPSDLGWPAAPAPPQTPPTAEEQRAAAPSEGAAPAPAPEATEASVPVPAETAEDAARAADDTSPATDGTTTGDAGAEAGEPADTGVAVPADLAADATRAAADVAHAESAPPRDATVGESLVREAMARLAAQVDVSHETPAAPPAASPSDVSHETPPPPPAPLSSPAVPAPVDVSHETATARSGADPAADVSHETAEYADTPIAAAAAAAVRATRQGAFPKPVHPRVLTVANQKGGVGKTTTTVNMAAGLALHGLSVLVVDLDPQGNASTALGVDHSAGTPNVYDVLVSGRPLAEIVQETSIPGLTCAPATIDLAGAEIELVPVVAREWRLKRALAAYDRPYDYVFIDCPPSLGLLTVNALVAAQEIVIPIQCEFYALEGLGQLLHNVELIRSHLNEQLQVSTILLTMYDGRTKLADQVATEVRSHFGDRVLESLIPRSVRISEAPGYGQTVLTYDPASRGAQAYLEAARELAERGARTEGS